MDPRALVSREQVRGGDQLLRRLKDGGFAVVGAAWAQTESDGQPYLYIVSPTVERDASFKPIRQLHVALDELNATRSDPSDRLDPFEIKLVGESGSLAQGILDWLQRHPDDRPTHHRGASLGGVPIDGAYIYPATMFTPPQPA